MRKVHSAGSEKRAAGISSGKRKYLSFIKYHFVLAQSRISNMIQ